jgi:hypothetical protein
MADSRDKKKDGKEKHKMTDKKSLFSAPILALSALRLAGYLCRLAEVDTNWASLWMSSKTTT